MKIVQIVKGYVLSNKSQKQQEEGKIYTLWVHPKANKFQIKQSIEEFYKVKVKRVNTCRKKPVLQKITSLQKSPGKFYTKLHKKAFIKLFPGYQLTATGAVAENKGSK